LKKKGKLWKENASFHKKNKKPQLEFVVPNRMDKEDEGDNAGRHPPTKNKSLLRNRKQVLSENGDPLIGLQWGRCANGRYEENRP